MRFSKIPWPSFRWPDFYVSEPIASITERFAYISSLLLALAVLATALVTLVGAVVLPFSLATAIALLWASKGILGTVWLLAGMALLLTHILAVHLSWLRRVNERIAL